MSKNLKHKTIYWWSWAVVDLYFQTHVQTKFTLFQISQPNVVCWGNKASFIIMKRKFRSHFWLFSRVTWNCIYLLYLKNVWELLWLCHLYIDLWLGQTMAWNTLYRIFREPVQNMPRHAWVRSNQFWKYPFISIEIFIHSIPCYIIWYHFTLNRLLNRGTNKQ